MIFFFYLMLFSEVEKGPNKNLKIFLIVFVFFVQFYNHDAKCFIE